MARVKVSDDYKVEIPEEVREPLDIKPGEELNVYRFGDRIELVPVKDIRQYRGFAKGIDTTVERDEDRL